MCSHPGKERADPGSEARGDASYETRTRFGSRERVGRKGSFERRGDATGDGRGTAADGLRLGLGIGLGGLGGGVVVGVCAGCGGEGVGDGRAGAAGRGARTTWVRGVVGFGVRVGLRNLGGRRGVGCCLPVGFLGGAMGYVAIVITVTFSNWWRAAEGNGIGLIVRWVLRCDAEEILGVFVDGFVGTRSWVTGRPCFCRGGNDRGCVCEGGIDGGFLIVVIVAEPIWSWTVASCPS